MTVTMLQERCRDLVAICQQRDPIHWKKFRVAAKNKAAWVLRMETFQARLVELENIEHIRAECTSIIARLHGTPEETTTAAWSVCFRSSTWTRELERIQRVEHRERRRSTAPSMTAAVSTVCLDLVMRFLGPGPLSITRTGYADVLALVMCDEVCQFVWHQAVSLHPTPLLHFHWDFHRLCLRDCHTLCMTDLIRFGAPLVTRQNVRLIPHDTVPGRNNVRHVYLPIDISTYLWETLGEVRCQVHMATIKK